MSYILDALKKSEEQRNNGKVVAPSYHAQPRPLRKTTEYLFPVTIVIVLALLVVAAIYYFDNKKKGVQPDVDALETTQEELAQNSHLVELKPTVKSPPIKEINNDPFNDEFTSFGKQNISKSKNQPGSISILKPEIKPETELEKNTEIKSGKPEITMPEIITNLFESPSYLKNQIPALNYSSHWHDPNPDKSVIIINNKSYKQGSWINNKIKIEKILQDETIFKIGSDKFKLVSLQNWNP